MITYNHEKYIREAIEGVLMQIVSFDIELIIADDNSPDNTESIILDIASRHPNGKWIKYTKHKTNKGMMSNSIWALQQCKSKYIAICEGDDYWTDPYKLQKQVDVLESNADYSLCFHKVNILNQQNQLQEDTLTKVPHKYDDIVSLAKEGNYIHTPSVLFRNKISKFPLNFSKSPIGDFYLYMLIAQYGKLYYIQEEMAVYREGVGVWSRQSVEYRIINTCKCFALVAEYFLFKKINIVIVILHRIDQYSQNFIMKERIDLYNNLSDFVDSYLLKFIFIIKKIIKQFSYNQRT